MENYRQLLTVASDVIAIDFEYRSENMMPPEVRCLCAVSLKTGKEWRLWESELSSTPPFPVDDTTVLVCHFAEAELSCFNALNWPEPIFVLDSSILIKQFRALPVKKDNGVKLLPPPFNKGTSLLATLESFGLSHSYEDTKQNLRELAMQDKRSKDFSVKERAELLDYCFEDVECYKELLPAICKELDQRKQSVLLFLGFTPYLNTCASMTYTGIPIDLAQWQKLCLRWPQVSGEFLAANDPLKLLFETGEFNREALRDFLLDNDYEWPAKPTKTGELDVSDKALERASELYPEIEKLRQARKLFKAMQAATGEQDRGLQIGLDGRARCFFAPLSTITTRNAPSNFIFSASKALRHLIKPPEGYAIASLDYTSQEFLIAGALSNDAAMIEDYTSGDVYMGFARRCGLVPQDATKETHPDERKIAKTLVLGIGYGMSKHGLAARMNMATFDAQELIDLYWKAYSTYYQWSENIPLVMQTHQYLELPDGWRLYPALSNNLRTIKNFAMQGTGGSILRYAVNTIREAGIQPIATNHDSIAILSPSNRIKEDTALTAQIMTEASQKYLNGHACKVDVEQLVKWPERYDPDDGRALYKKLTELCK